MMHGRHSIKDVLPEIAAIMFSAIPPQLLAVAEKNLAKKIEGIFKTGEKMEACMLFRPRVLIQLLKSSFPLA